MPVYEYYCRDCETKFEKLRPIRAAEDSADCPSGHPGAARTLSVFAVFGGERSGEIDMTSFGGGGGGCACGGACGCRN